MLVFKVIHEKKSIVLIGGKLQWDLIPLPMSPSPTRLNLSFRANKAGHRKTPAPAEAVNIGYGEVHREVPKRRIKTLDEGVKEGTVRG